MINKNLIIIFFFIFLSSCGYSTVYNNSTDSEIKIVVLEMKGSRELNNKINSSLKKYINNKSDKIFKITFNTNLDKDIISKDSKGKVTNYQLKAVSNILVDYNNKTFSYSFKENLNIKNIDDTFEQKKYENVVKNNFASSIKEKLILKLKTLK